MFTGNRGKSLGSLLHFRSCRPLWVWFVLLFAIAGCGKKMEEPAASPAPVPPASVAAPPAEPAAAPEMPASPPVAAAAPEAKSAAKPKESQRIYELHMLLKQSGSNPNRDKAQPKMAAPLPPPPPKELASAPPNPVSKNGYPAATPDGAPRAAPARGGEATWNTWFERGGKPVEVLQPESRYELVLDISMYRYLARLSAVAGPEVRKKIAQSRDLESLRFVVRPFSLDGKLRLSATEGALDARMARLFGAPPEDEAQRIERYRNGDLSLADFAHGVQAGEVRFGVVTLAPGCAAIALSVWDETGLFPLDQLVVSIPVAAANAPAPACGSAGETRAVVEQGAGALLQVSLERSPLEPAPAASLHLFETMVLGRPRTAVVMVERSAYKRSNGAEGVYAWLTEALLSDYLARPEQLRVQIDEARRQASRNTPFGYAPVARELAAKLFSQESGGTDVAGQAREALRRAVADSTDPVIVARMVTASGERAFMPLGLLGARADAPVVARPMTVIEPLPLERYPGSRACINTWTLAVPERLEGMNDAELSGAAQLSGLASRVKTENELARYMADTAPATKPEGLILLAHHSAGYLWFTDKTARVGREGLARRYAPGSVAVLSACTTASPEGDNLAWATKLNRQGIDAMIMSPFPVPADYAVRLALEFGGAVSSARASNATPTFLELFRSATRASADYFRAKYGAGVAYDELALEFVVAGDPSLRLCAHP